jgi:hypothetical protein
MPAGHVTASSSTPPAPPLLLLRVETSERQAARISWIASVHCRITGTDDGQRAEDLSRVIGRSLGRRIERGPL